MPTLGRGTRTLPPGIRNFLLVTHRWLGLSSAVVLAIAGGTGALLAWPWWLTEEPVGRWVAARIHESLGLGFFGLGFIGYWSVTIATGGGVLLLFGGLVLWWRRKIATVRTNRGWQRGVFDLHHAVGAVGFAFMLLVASTGLGIVFLRPEDGVVFEVAFALHTTRGFHWTIKLLYLAGSLAFTLQVATGVAMWWQPIGSRNTHNRARASGERPRVLSGVAELRRSVMSFLEGRI
jgi:uncharacterized iron-regulated membrane protein